MDVTFLEDQKYFLQLESKGTEEENFWDVIPNPLPTTVVESEHNLETQVEPRAHKPKLSTQSDRDPTSGEETLHSVPKDKNNELLVYTNRRHQQRSKIGLEKKLTEDQSLDIVPSLEGT
ncbi:hypothetical protein DsansV1_C11g0110951 [Dioscorea sansibarensis]